MLASTFLFTLFLNSKGFIFNTKPVDSADTSIEQNDIVYYDNNVYSDNEDPMEKKTDDDFDDKVNIQSCEKMLRPCFPVLDGERQKQ